MCIRDSRSAEQEDLVHGLAEADLERVRQHGVQLADDRRVARHARQSRRVTLHQRLSEALVDRVPGLERVRDRRLELGGAGRVPVSYTHLNVYKRQVLR